MILRNIVSKKKKKHFKEYAIFFIYDYQSFWLIVKYYIENYQVHYKLSFYFG